MKVYMNENMSCLINVKQHSCILSKLTDERMTSEFGGTRILLPCLFIPTFHLSLQGLFFFLQRRILSFSECQSHWLERGHLHHVFLWFQRPFFSTRLFFSHVFLNTFSVWRYWIRRVTHSTLCSPPQMTIVICSISVPISLTNTNSLCVNLVFSAWHPHNLFKFVECVT